MKVYIGPYRNWIGPYQIADMIFFWLKKYPEDHLEQRWDYKLRDKVGLWLAGEDHDTWLAKFCLWVESKRKRKIKVRIDNYDVWGMDHTLALIILPMLKKLKEVKHGAPLVDDGDVPLELKSTSAPPKENKYDTDGNHFKRWDWVLDEMIFAFECKLDDNWDDQFWSGEFGKSEFVETGEEHFNPLTNKVEKTYTMKSTGNLTCDWEARKVVSDRISNGFRLFGKYYEALWD